MLSVLLAGESLPAGEIAAAVNVTPPHWPVRCAYPCLDRSERRDHPAGPLATALLDHFLAQRWIARIEHSRALKVTPLGARVPLPTLETR